VTRPDPLAGFRRERHPGFELSVDSLDDSSDGFAQSVVRGLTDHPRWLHCRYLYDAEGSEIFERICDQPEYYQTRTEALLLVHHADEIRRLVPARTLVELGSGSSAKTRHLLRTWTAGGTRARYVPVDVSRSMLVDSCRALSEEHRGLEVHGIAASYERALPRLRELSPLMLIFLGSTIGNLNPDETADFLDRVSASLAPGDHFLLGIDLVKDVRTLEAAYNDAAGFSAAFTRNLFARMNRELGTRLDLGAIEHVAYYNDRLDRIEIFARFAREQAIEVRDAGRRFRIARGEMVLTEISRKFQVDEMAANVARFGLETVRTFTDATKAFGLLLLRMRDRRTVTAGRERTVGTHLGGTRARTLELIEPLADDQLRQQWSPLMSPIMWDLGHIANYEEQWSLRALEPHATVPAEAHARDFIYDPISHPRASRRHLPLPERAECLAYLHEVRRRTRQRLEQVSFDPGDPLLAEGYVYKMIAQHEAQHTETILQTIRLIDGFHYAPGRRREPARAVVPVDRESAIVPAGPFIMGTDDRGVAYDNERPAHAVDLPRYRIDLAPVTNGQYLAFVRDGGYRRRELWTDAGWLWLAEARVTHPLGWVRQEDGSFGEDSFGRLAPLVVERPVIHVSWYEAEAFARWAGKRLPTEAEWEKAAAWDLETRVARRYPWGDNPPTQDHANLDQRTFAPAPVGAYPRGRSFFGCHQMLGCVWEWTATDFAPYPGFVAFPYREYSEVHFGRGYKVLRGGSWATQPIAIRNTFRNWDLPERRQIFAGFRCAADA
jgi:gamma-glutamyl hercynylcysteine S-oxide synthase